MQEFFTDGTMILADDTGIEVGFSWGVASYRDQPVITMNGAAEPKYTASFEGDTVTLALVAFEDSPQSEPPREYVRVSTASP